MVENKPICLKAHAFIYTNTAKACITFQIAHVSHKKSDTILIVSLMLAYDKRPSQHPQTTMTSASPRRDRD